jgi:hypothetical protein
MLVSRVFAKSRPSTPYMPGAEASDTVGRVGSHFNKSVIKKDVRVVVHYKVFDAEAIFAFSITFMAISIQIPHLSDNNNKMVIQSQAEIITKLELRPQFEIYRVSFFIIGNLLGFISSCFQSYNSFSYNNDMVKTFIRIVRYTYFFCYCYSNKLWSISYF